MNEFLHAVNATRVSDGGGAPTEDEVAIINDRIALTPQSSDSLFTWRFVISNTEVDSHGTWMDTSSLENYAHQANTGRGIPYLRHHNTESDERGRVFAANLVAVQASDQPLAGVQTARAAFRAHGPSMSLVETAFMVRGLTLNGTPNDDLIRNIEAGVSASNSIGFSVYTPAAPGSYLECDICERDMFERGPDGKYVCPHQPGVDYEVERGEGKQRYHVIATARVVNAMQREASGVYLGSTPGTFTLAARAHEAFEMGQATERDARLVEDVLHLQRGMVTLGRPATVWSIPPTVTVPHSTGTNCTPTVHVDPASYGDIVTTDWQRQTWSARAWQTWDDNTTAVPGAGTAIPDTETPADDSRADNATGDDMDNESIVARVRELLAGDPDRVARLELADVSTDSDPVGALYRVLEDELTEAIAARDADAEARQEFVRVVRERLTLDDGEDIAAGIDRIMAEVSIAREFKGDLIAELLRQMTRCQLSYDEDQQRALADTWPIAQIKAQTDMYRETANKLYPPGRVTEPVIKPRKAPVANPATVQG